MPLYDFFCSIFNRNNHDHISYNPVATQDAQEKFIRILGEENFWRNNQKLLRVSVMCADENKHSVRVFNVREEHWAHDLLCQYPYKRETGENIKFYWRNDTQSFAHCHESKVDLNHKFATLRENQFRRAP